MDKEEYKIILRLKSGREFHFSCEKYSISTTKLSRELIHCDFEGVAGEYPLYFKIEDVESISCIV